MAGFYIKNSTFTIINAKTVWKGGEHILKISFIKGIL